MSNWLRISSALAGMAIIGYATVLWYGSDLNEPQAFARWWYLWLPGTALCLPAALRR